MVWLLCVIESWWTKPASALGVFSLTKSVPTCSNTYAKFTFDTLCPYCFVDWLFSLFSIVSSMFLNCLSILLCAIRGSNSCLNVGNVTFYH